MDRAEAKIVSRPWEPQDLIDDLQMYIDEEPDNYLNGRRTAMCMARDYLKKFFEQESLAQATSEWVSVDERLPEVGKTVLTLDKRGHINDRYTYKCADGVAVFTAEYLTSSKDITHWMPLPEPPKEGAE